MFTARIRGSKAYLESLLAWDIDIEQMNLSMLCHHLSCFISHYPGDKNSRHLPRGSYTVAVLYTESELDSSSGIEPVHQLMYCKPTERLTTNQPTTSFLRHLP